MLDLWCMLAAAGQVCHWTSGQRLNQRFERLKLAVCMDLGDTEATLEMVGVDLLESLENLWNSPVRQMIDRREACLPTQRQKEWNLVDKKDVSSQEHFPVKVQ